MIPGCPITHIEASSFVIPTERRESDGTFEWNATTIILAEVDAGGMTGLGLTYTHRIAAHLIHEQLTPVLIGKDALDTQACWDAMVRSVRNLGRPGLAMMAISAVDFALWDLKAKLLGLPLHRLLGTARSSVPVYGSGGFTSYSGGELTDQLSGWVSQGIRMVKMKVGRDPSRDEERVRAARAAIGRGTSLFVDANGAYDRKQALKLADRFANHGVSWFEEPVSSDDLAGLRLLRDRAPDPMQIAAGEYGWDAPYFARMIEAGAVDVLQADATRCGGVTGFLKALALAEAAHLPLSAHCAPSVHLALGCHSRHVAHLEYFHDHARLERLLFDGVEVPRDGALHPDNSRPGLGLTLKKQEAAAWAA
jgi:L-alanine-DL-glutamate epimerase-like enolase superfamily enzyme